MRKPWPWEVVKARRSAPEPAGAKGELDLESSKNQKIAEARNSMRLY